MASSPVVSHPYTCNTCQVAFKNGELQRGHMQSDWHRYNLKRRVASLPPLSSEIFTEKVLANQASTAATAACASFERICASCQRTYYSENAYQNHLSSNKHRLRVAQMTSERQSVATEGETNSAMSSAFSLGEPINVQPPAVDDPAVEAEFFQVVDGVKKAKIDDVDPVVRRPRRPRPSVAKKKPEHPLSPVKHDNSMPQDEHQPEDESPEPTQCLFCNTLSDSVDSNASHMKQSHGMFIPERAYLVDLEGLLNWLHDRISLFHECLFCGLVRPTAHGIQTHMRDKGHCMIAFESEEQMIEVGQFYDFQSTYSDDEWESDDDAASEPDGGIKLDANEDVHMADGDGWETDGSESVAQNRVSSETSKLGLFLVPGKQSVYQDEDGLHLPSGRTAGHRSLARYFRQNLHHYATPGERLNRLAITNGSSADASNGHNNGNVIKRAPRGRPENAITRADGGLGMLGVSGTKKKEAKSKELADRKRAQQQQNRYQWGNERRANHQAHYRDPLLQ